MNSLSAGQPAEDVKNGRIGRLRDRGLRQADFHDDEKRNEEEGEKPRVGHKNGELPSTSSLKSRC